MKYSEAQKIVHEWISQFPEGYFSPSWIVTQMAEEQGELLEQIEANNLKEIKKEIGDMFFPFFCYANSRKINLEGNLNPITESYAPMEAYKQIINSVRKVAKESLHLFGPKKKKENEGTEQLKSLLEEGLTNIKKIAKAYEFKPMELFNNNIEKLYKRDNFRWERFDKK